MVLGVSGSGKSTLGAALARRLGLPFADGDDLHPTANIAKMTAGTPLDDADRYPWLERVGDWLTRHRDGGVIACSALKRRYRDQLRRHCPEAVFLFLTGEPGLIAERQAGRVGHFMPPSLLASQFDVVEPLQSDEKGITLDVAAAVDDIVTAYLARTGPTDTVRS